MEEKELIERLTRVEECTKSNTHRIEDVESKTKEIHEMNVTMNGILIEMQHMREDQNKSNVILRDDINGVKNDVNAINKKIAIIEDEPIKNKANSWDKVKWKIGELILVAIVVYLIGMALPFLK